MITVNIHEAKTRLSALLRLVEEKGDFIRICRNGRPVADIRPIDIVNKPLEQNPELMGVMFNENPVLPLKNEDWPIESR